MPTKPTDTELLDWLESQYINCRFRCEQVPYPPGGKQLLVMSSHYQDTWYSATIRDAIEVGMAKEANAESPTN